MLDFLNEGLPSWMIVGVLAVLGWMYEVERDKTIALAEAQLETESRLATLEQAVKDQQTTNGDIKDALIRIEDYLLESTR